MTVTSDERRSMIERAARGEEGLADGAGAPVVLEDALTIADVGHWHARLLAVARPGTSLVIDASGLEQVDGAGAQLLVALFLDGERRGYDVLLRGCSPALREAAARLGLSTLLRLDGDAAE